MIFLECLLIAVVAFVYTELITEEGQVLGWLHRVLSKLPAPLFKPLIGCGYCVAGQMSLWLYLVLHWSEWNLLIHVAYICLTIFTVHVILIINHKLYQ